MILREVQAKVVEGDFRTDRYKSQLLVVQRLEPLKRGTHFVLNQDVVVFIGKTQQSRGKSKDVTILDFHFTESCCLNQHGSFIDKVWKFDKFRNFGF